MTFQQTSSSTQPTIEQQQTYEELLAERIAEEHMATSKRFGVPLWILRYPGKRIEVEDDDVAFEERT